MWKGLAAISIDSYKFYDDQTSFSFQQNHICGSPGHSRLISRSQSRKHEEERYINWKWWKTWVFNTRTSQTLKCARNSTWFTMQLRWTGTFNFKPSISISTFTVGIISTNAVSIPYRRLLRIYSHFLDAPTLRYKPKSSVTSSWYTHPNFRDTYIHESAAPYQWYCPINGHLPPSLKRQLQKFIAKVIHWSRTTGQRSYMV
jgi:hypothetical protein